MSAMCEYCNSTVKEVESTPSSEEILNISLKLGAEFPDWDTKQAHLRYFQNDLHKACSLSSNIWWATKTANSCNSSETGLLLSLDKIITNAESNVCARGEDGIH